ncbi:MAG: hypothetical protein M1365_11945, partial [Actinobacteria bacterium]|nr:hypothetical protein [Actinomycetota bacterium]
ALDISIMRGLYQELTYINSRISKPTVIEEDNKLKNECEELIQGKNDKLISADLFVFKIITTLEKINYKSCSKKQYDIILEALTKLRKEKKSIENKKEIEHTKIISDIDAEIYGDSLLDMSNALGDGDIL